MTNANTDIHGGNIWYAAKKYNLKPEDIVDFSANINPFATAKRIADTVLNCINDAAYYPDPEYTSLKKSIASYVDAPVEAVLPGNGSCDLLHLIAQAFHPEKAIIITPAFSEYENALTINKSDITFIHALSAKNFAVALDDISSHLKHTDMLFICNPNNPTGTLIKKDELIEIVSFCKRYSTMVIIDEAFIEFINSYKAVSLAQKSLHMDNLLVVRSLTKMFAIPGIRIGYAIGHPDNIKRLKACQRPWAVNCFAEKAAIELIGDTCFIEDSVRSIDEQRRFLSEELHKIEGLRVFAGRANFMLCNIESKGLNSHTLVERMGQQGILLRDCSSLRGLDDRYFRVAVRTYNENLKLVRGLREVFGNAC